MAIEQGIWKIGDKPEQLQPSGLADEPRTREIYHEFAERYGREHDSLEAAFERHSGGPLERTDIQVSKTAFDGPPQFSRKPMSRLLLKSRRSRRFERRQCTAQGVPVRDPPHP